MSLKNKKSINWKVLENHSKWRIRLQAYLVTKNWKKAMYDKRWEIRYEAFYQTNDWYHGLDDTNVIIRKEAIKRYYIKEKFVYQKIC